MKNKALEIDIKISKEKLIESLKNYTDKRDYIRIGEHKDYDVCLELVWRKDKKPFVEYLYLANVIDNKLIGNIVKPPLNYKRQEKKTAKDIFSMIMIAIYSLLFFYGFPFFIIYAFSESILLSSLISLVPLSGLILFVKWQRGSTEVHENNIRKLIKNIEG